MSRRTLTFVSHTHWDREWYQPFEEYRIRLVQMIDKLLHILDTDPEYRHFMLDGQTIVLEDYLAIRPEKEKKLRNYVESGRLLIGPWYILPDEFLVSAESTIRNLIVGARVCARFGKRMNVGNIPDPFGHISQLPQILRGFDIETAVFWRGVGEAPNEFVWAAPDGTDVLVIHQHNGYGNASNMPATDEAFVGRTRQIIDGLAPTATTPHLLAMNGSDHQEPQPELPRLLALADEALPEIDLVHGTLPQFIAAVRASNPTLETISGELRHCSRMPLLPGVLSARMWIKQRNAACEALLTRWAEPMAAIAEIAGAPLSLHNQSALVKQAWRYLLQNHPHDSICGCSIDQVHSEMNVRFDWVEQIGGDVAKRCLGGLAAVVDTSTEEDSPAVVVFNPTTRPRSDVVSVQVPVPEDAEDIVLVSDGQAVHPQMTEKTRDVAWQFELPAARFQAMVGQGLPDQIDGQGMQDMAVSLEGTTVSVNILLARDVPPDRERLAQGRAELARLLQEGHAENVHILLHRGMVATCTFVAQAVPGLGYRTYWVRLADAHNVPDHEAREPVEPVIENEYLRVEVADDGTCSLLDKRTGVTYPGLNRFVDVGDRGDEYNFCPVEEDVVVSVSSVKPLVCLTEYGSMRQTLEVSMLYQVPASLGETRGQRGEDLVELPITTCLRLVSGVPRLEIETTIDNSAADHRVRAHFPVPVHVDQFQTEAHFDVITRAIDLPQDTEAWVEQPVPTHPQCTWADVSDGEVGLVVANRGLPEIEVLRTDGGSEIALTLLRCVGWLSRGDMSVRQGHAGPGLPTPEAQCIDEYTFHYALIPHAGDWQEAVAEAHAFAVPMRAASTGSHAGTLAGYGNFVEVGPKDLVVTAIKEAEAGSGLVVRFWNTSTETKEGEVKLWTRPSKAVQCNLAERAIRSLDIDGDGVVCVSARGREVVTLFFAFE